MLELLILSVLAFTLGIVFIMCSGTWIRFLQEKVPLADRASVAYSFSLFSWLLVVIGSLFGFAVTGAFYGSWFYFALGALPGCVVTTFFVYHFVAIAAIFGGSSKTYSERKRINQKFFCFLWISFVVALLGLVIFHKPYL